MMPTVYVPLHALQGTHTPVYQYMFTEINNQIYKICMVSSVKFMDNVPTLQLSHMKHM